MTKPDVLPSVPYPLNKVRGDKGSLIRKGWSSNREGRRRRHASRGNYLPSIGQYCTGWSGKQTQSSLPLAGQSTPLIRFADDFIITGNTREILEDKVAPIVK